MSDTNAATTDRDGLVWQCRMCRFVVLDLDYQSIKCNPMCECGEQAWFDFMPKRGFFASEETQ